MNLTELIQSRRTIQTYNSNPVAESLVQEALVAALWSPNHKLTFPWRFIIAGSETRKKLARVAAEVKAEKNGGSVSSTDILMTEKTYLIPSHMIILSMVRSLDPRRLKEDYASVAMGVQNISLFLWQHQVGTKWSSGAPTVHPKTYEVLGVNPAEEELVGYLWVGHFDVAPPARPRPPLEKMVRHLP